MPNQGDTVIRAGQSVNITWESNDIEQVVFSLFKNGQSIQDIFSKTSENKSNNTTVWTPNESLIDENVPYTIRIQMSSNRSVYDQTPPFYILNKYKEPTPVPVITVKLDRSSINEGETAKLVWNTTNATSVSIDGVGTFDANGSVDVSPSISTTYKVIAFGTGGETITSVMLNVVKKSDPVPKITSFSINKNQVYDGDDIKISWSTLNATKIIITDGTVSHEKFANDALNGEMYLKLELNQSSISTKTYVMTAYGTGGQTDISDSKTVSILRKDNQIINISTISNKAVYNAETNVFDSKAKLSWNVENLNSGDVLILTNLFDGSTSQIESSGTSEFPIVYSNIQSMITAIKSKAISEVTYQFNVKNSSGKIVGNTKIEKIYLSLSTATPDPSINVSTLDGKITYPYGTKCPGFYITPHNATKWTMIRPDGTRYEQKRTQSDNSTITYTTDPSGFSAGVYTFEVEGVLINGSPRSKSTSILTISYGSKPSPTVDFVLNSKTFSTDYKSVSAVLSWTTQNASAKPKLIYQDVNGGSSEISVDYNGVNYRLDNIVNNTDVKIDASEGVFKTLNVSMSTPDLPQAIIPVHIPGIPFFDTTVANNKVIYGILNYEIKNSKQNKVSMKLTYNGVEKISEVPAAGPTTFYCDNGTYIEIIAYDYAGSEISMGKIKAELNVIPQTPVLTLTLSNVLTSDTSYTAFTTLSITNETELNHPYYLYVNGERKSPFTDKASVPGAVITADSIIEVRATGTGGVEYKSNQVTAKIPQAVVPSFTSPIRSDKDSYGFNEFVMISATASDAVSAELKRIAKGSNIAGGSSTKILKVYTGNPTSIAYQDVANEGTSIEYILTLYNSSGQKTSQSKTISVSAQKSNAVVSYVSLTDGQTFQYGSTVEASYTTSGAASYVRVKLISPYTYGFESTKYPSNGTIKFTMPKSDVVMEFTPYDANDLQGDTKTISLKYFEKNTLDTTPQFINNISEKGNNTTVKPGDYVYITADVKGSIARIKEGAFAESVESTIKLVPGQTTPVVWNFSVYQDTIYTITVYEYEDGSGRSVSQSLTIRCIDNEG